MFPLLFAWLLFPHCFSVIVTTSYGKLRGKLLNFHGEDIYLFTGIPQASPPLHNLRFSMPEPPKPWDGVLDATKNSVACLSTIRQKGSPPIDEDCLYLNVFTSKKCMENSCPVIFYVHGGGMYYNSPPKYNETFMAERYTAKGFVVNFKAKYVVFVIPAYRMGLFGELLVGDLIPQNLAIYDIMAGLEWNHNEIRNFGGDPNRVTLMGHSSGASTAIFLSTSQLIDPDRRLFQQTIALSGDAFFEKYENRRNFCEELIQKAQCNASDPHAILECLRRKDAHFLLSIQGEIDKRDIRPIGNLYGPPFVESFNVPVKDFIRNIPRRDMLLGSTAAEFFNGSTGSDLPYGQFIGLTHEEEIRTKFDADWKDENGNPLPPNYMSHTVFLSIVYYASALENNGGSVYVQEYSQPPLPMHAADMKYFIGSHIEEEMTDDEMIIDKFYSQRLVNCVKYGKPSRDAKKFDYPTANYYDIIVDKDKDLWPSYKTNYHKNIEEYWKGMTVYDEILDWIDKINGRQTP